MEIKKNTNMPKELEKDLINRALLFKVVLEGRKDNKDMLEAFEGIIPTEDKEEKIFFLCESDTGYITRLIMTPKDIFMEVSKGIHFCKALVSKDCYANTWLRERFS